LTTGIETKLDPITFAVMRNGFIAAADDMYRTFKRTAMLPILYEFNDFGMSIFDDRLNVIADAPGLPIFVGSLDGCLAETIKGVGGRENLEPDDILINNHPYLTAGQPADLAVMQPIFALGELIGYVALRGHMGDMGAMGIYPTNSTEIYQEGTLIPPLKLYRAGVLDPTIPAIIDANSRLPRETVGSILAAAGSLRAAARKMTAIVEKYGIAAYRAAVQDVLAHGERVARAAIERIPDGEYVIEEYMDDNGITDEPVLIRCALRIDGSDVVIDLTGSAPQQVAAINCPWGYTLTTCRFALKRLTTPDHSANSGQFAPLTVIAPEGSLFNPRAPAGCFIGAWSSIRLSDMIIRAASLALPERVPAGNGGDLVQLLAYIHPPDSEKLSFFAELGPLGHGGREGGDGMNGLIHPIEAGAQNIPTELIENRMPVIKRRYEFVQDSGGPGKFRGGLSAEVDIEFTGIGTAVVSCERSRIEEVPGVAGGWPAPFKNAVLIYPGTERELHLGKRSDIAIAPGDRAIMRPAGGGGYGDPLDRDTAAVQADVRGGYVSVESAREIYGVVFASDGTVDAEATASARRSGGPQ
jgi:N-methylhydantoinase B